jgi:hypothetical protein
MKNISGLDLSDNFLSDEALFILSEALAGSEVLQKLVLDRNFAPKGNVTIKGNVTGSVREYTSVAKEIANTNLPSITVESLIRLIQRTSKNNNVKELIVTDVSSLSIAGAPKCQLRGLLLPFLEELVSNTTLTELNISGRIQQYLDYSLDIP